MYAKKKSVSMKAVVLLLAVVLLIGCVAGGTIAYLMANTNTVTNTFVVGDIGDLKLYENDEEITTATTKSFTIVPGKDLTKNVTVSYSYTDVTTDKKDDVAVYVFVKVETTDWSVTNNKDYAITETVEDTEGDETTRNLLSWSIDSGWTYLTTEENARVYYKAVAENASLDKAVVIAENGKITVSSEIAKTNIDAVAAGAGNITFTAYAIQQDTFSDATAAWAAAKTAQ